MAKIERFEDLEIWQTARTLTKGVYQAARTQKLGTDHALSNQMKRAAVSIGSNISEGFERGTRKQFLEACYIAKGSAGELRSQVITAWDVGLLDQRAYEWLFSNCEQCSKQLYKFIRHLRITREKLPGSKYLTSKNPEGVTGG